MSDRETAPAKINLALHVRGRRSDGYHALETLAVFAPEIADVVSTSPRGDGLSVDGDFADNAGDGDSNLVIRAANAFAQHSRRPPPPLSLIKTIPVGGGLGGGSADAAATLRLLNRSLDTPLPATTLEEIAAGLGADVPMCVRSVPVRASGIGEMLDDVAGLPELPLVLVFPGTGVSTAVVFATRPTGDDGPLPPVPAGLSVPGFTAWLATTRNGLEAPSRTIAPVIGDVLTELTAAPDCLLARMTGSGSCCFGIFASRAVADAAAAIITKRRPGWWVRSTTTAAV